VSEAADVRAEHDALAERLAVRRSVDQVWRGAYAGFLGLVSALLSVKLACDRWISAKATRFRGPLAFFIGTGLLAALLLGHAAWCAARARRLMRAEDADFARLRLLRDRLGLDP
jgi:hypothetical protein